MGPARRRYARRRHWPGLPVGRSPHRLARWRRCRRLPRGRRGSRRARRRPGRDRAGYELSDTGVTVDLAAGTGRGGHAEGDQLSAIEHLQGSRHADYLRATRLPTTASLAGTATTPLRAAMGPTVSTAAAAPMSSTEVPMSRSGSETAFSHSPAPAISPSTISFSRSRPRSRAARQVAQRAFIPAWARGVPLAPRGFIPVRAGTMRRQGTARLLAKMQRGPEATRQFLARR